jgi:hypothetical protein
MGPNKPLYSLTVSTILCYIKVYTAVRVYVVCRKWGPLFCPGWNLSVIHSFEAESNKFQSLTFETRPGNLESTVLWRRFILKFFRRICKHKCDSSTCVDMKSFRALITAQQYGALMWRESQKLNNITSTIIVVRF